MTREEFDILCSPAVRQAVHERRGENPLDVALDKHLPHAGAVASQLKYLARAAEKLPRYAEAECILPARAFEQASSEAVAATKRIGGQRLLDLTCGLGVDALALSRRFDEVVTLERDPVLAAVARENFRRLGAENITVVNASAEEFLAGCRERFDWIYADPDRRDAEGRRKVRMEECSPDILALKPLIERVSGRLCLKLSPLFDVDEAFRLFPRSRVEAVSLRGECKEVAVYADGSEPVIAAEAVGIGRLEVPLAEVDDRPTCDIFLPERYHWLIVPDAALRKARLACHALRGHCFIASDNGYAFAEERPEEVGEGSVLGRIFEIERIIPYQTRELKRSLKGLRAEILKRDFPLSTAQILEQTGLREGAEARVAFTRVLTRNWMIRLKPED